MHNEILTPQERQDLKIEYSRGRGKFGQQYVYIRPARPCFNRSRRTTPDNIPDLIRRFFPVVNYFLIEGEVIGAPNEKAALKEWWRVCEMSQIGKITEVQMLP